MKKLLILLIMFITIVYCSNCTIEQQNLVKKEKDSATLQQGHTKKVGDIQYRSDVPIWLLRSI